MELSLRLDFAIFSLIALSLVCRSLSSTLSTVREEAVYWRRKSARLLFIDAREERQFELKNRKQEEMLEVLCLTDRIP